jgi:hypothetical protein
MSSALAVDEGGSVCIRDGDKNFWPRSCAPRFGLSELSMGPVRERRLEPLRRKGHIAMTTEACRRAVASIYVAFLLVAIGQLWVVGAAESWEPCALDDQDKCTGELGRDGRECERLKRTVRTARLQRTDQLTIELVQKVPSLEAVTRAQRSRLNWRVVSRSAFVLQMIFVFLAAEG